MPPTPLKAGNSTSVRKVLSPRYKIFNLGSGLGCPAGWRDGSSVGMGCLQFNAQTGMDWNEAKDYCKTTELGASLVEILTSEQMDFIMVELGLLETTVKFNFFIISRFDLCLLLTT